MDSLMITLQIYALLQHHQLNAKQNKTFKIAQSINNWMNGNKLKMNNSKTEFLMFGSRKQLDKCVTESVVIINDSIPKQKLIHYLGAFLDEKFNFKEHITRKCKTAMLNYFKIKSIRKYLTSEATEILVLSLVV